MPLLLRRPAVFKGQSVLPQDIGFQRIKCNKCPELPDSQISVHYKPDLLACARNHGVMPELFSVHVFQYLEN